jgi:outer membrane receptor protein involved in Fe transport
MISRPTGSGRTPISSRREALVSLEQCLVVLGVALGAMGAHADGVQRLDRLDVTGHYDTGVGSADAASAGVITPQLIDDRPLLRPGEILEYIPGMIVTQHSGAGKANQYFLRGFNLDHGTDFATYLAGMPVNMRTHAHGQGYTDLNFVIPELVARVDYFKGPYFAQGGDFAVAGGANIHYFTTMKSNLAELTGGTYEYGRALLVGSAETGPGRFVYGFEAVHDNGPWEVPENFRKYNGVLRYTVPLAGGFAGVTAMAYQGQWTATDQIAQRAVDEGLVSRFGSLNDTDGGKSYRYSLSLDGQLPLAGGQVQTTAYAIRYYLNLFSDFTYYLNNPIDGDQFNQYDNRRIYGWNGSWTRFDTYLGKPMQNSFGWDIRQDRIDPVGLYDTVRRERIATTREDNVRETSYALYFENQTSWNEWLRSIVGIRGESYDFDVQSNIPSNSGSKIANMGLPKFSLIFGPWSKTEYFINAGQGFHSNDARGVVATVDPKTGEPIDSATPLVRASGAELGVRSEIVPNLQSSLAFWYLKLGSELVFSGDEGTTEPGRPSKRIGIEWSNHYTPKAWLLLDLDLAWTKARFTDSDPVGNHIPDALQATAQAGITIQNLGPWTASLWGRYFGPRTLIEDGSVKSNSTTVFSAQASYQVNPQTRIRFDIFNLLNSKANDITYYYVSRLPGEPPEGVADLHFHPMESRSVRLGLLYNF